MRVGDPESKLLRAIYSLLHFTSSKWDHTLHACIHTIHSNTSCFGIAFTCIKNPPLSNYNNGSNYDLYPSTLVNMNQEYIADAAKGHA